MNYFFTEYELSLVKVTKSQEKIADLIPSISYVKGMGNYSVIVLKDNSERIFAKTLRQIEEILFKHSNFVRTSKCSIVNLECIVDLKFNCRGGEMLVNNDIITISRRNASIFREDYDNYLKSKGFNSERRLQPFISKWNSKLI